MRCVGYVRYTSCVSEKTIPSDIIRQQNERICKYIKHNGWELVRKYADRKQDAGADEAFRAMQKDGINREFDMVVVDSILRCGTNVSYAEDILLKSFYPAGIHFAVVEDDVCSLNLTWNEAKTYFKKKKNEYMGAMLYSHTKAKQAQGYLSVHDEKYGYLLNEERKGFVTDEEAVPIIREIFHLIGDSGMTYKQVSDLMNEKGYESPMKHLARVGHKRRADVKSKWVPASVKRIAENTAYIGYWYKMIDGIRTELKIKPIIEKELFDKAAQRYADQPNKNLPSLPRSDNAFVKQIFDKTTGASLICRLHREDEPYQTFGMDFWAMKNIRYDDVMDQAVSVLQKEQRMTEYAKEWIASEAGQLEKQRRRTVLGVRAKALFEDMAELEKAHLSYYLMSENGEITEDDYRKQRKRINGMLAKKEMSFQKLMEQADELETAFSSKNPWIALYGSIEIPKRLTKDEVRKWIDRILVENMENVEVYLPEKYTRWRDMLSLVRSEVV